eukprot:Unigene6204_Nuclearia_a/m.19104 Unigene6204_Nuclearia_a/g.19104  ORF Unigene6204_Nuclearia_a/g.19104 Unigene6204_Nuclearia_a/m.19104 type:complete len:302 (-) Unigene6204_Nuclearia_a:819-1724(-)
MSPTHAADVGGAGVAGVTRCGRILVRMSARASASAWLKSVRSSSISGALLARCFLSVSSTCRRVASTTLISRGAPRWMYSPAICDACSSTVALSASSPRSLISSRKRWTSSTNRTSSALKQSTACLSSRSISLGLCSMSESRRPLPCGSSDLCARRDLVRLSETLLSGPGAGIVPSSSTATALASSAGASGLIGVSGIFGLSGVRGVTGTISTELVVTPAAVDESRSTLELLSVEPAVRPVLLRRRSLVSRRVVLRKRARTRSNEYDLITGHTTELTKNSHSWKSMMVPMDTSMTVKMASR